MPEPEKKEETQDQPMDYAAAAKDIAGEIKDLTKQDLGAIKEEAPTVEPEVEDKNDKTEKETALESLLEETGFSSKDELKEALEDLESYKDLQELIGDRDLEEVFEKADMMTHYEKAMADQEAKKEAELEAEESLDETVQRYKAENRKLKKEKEDRLRKEAEVRAKEKNYRTFTTIVKSRLKKAGIKGDDADIIAEFMGVDNPINDADISDPRAVEKILDRAIKKITTFKGAKKEPDPNKEPEPKKEKPIISPTAAATAAKRQPKNWEELEKLAEEVVGQL